MQQRRIDDYWNIDGSRELSDSWTGFTQFTLLEEKPPDVFLWSGERLTRKQLTSRPDRLWPELWIKMGRNAKLKERQKWSHEKPQLDNARKLRGIQRNHQECSQEIGNANGSCNPCKTSKKGKHGATRGKSNEKKSKLACTLEASESTRLRVGESLPNHHEDHIAGKGDNSLQHKNLVHIFIPMPQAMKISAAKAAVDKEWEKNAELETKHQKYKGRVVLRGDIVKDDSGSYAVFTEQGSSAPQMTAAKVMDIMSRLPGCAGQAADAVSVCTQVKMEDAHKLFKIPKLECPDIWIRLPRHKWPKSWSNMEDPVVLLERNLYGHPFGRTVMERQFEKILLKYGWEKVSKLGMSLCSS